MGLYLPMKYVSSGMHPWSLRLLLMVLVAVLLMASGCGPAGGDEATDGGTEAAIETSPPTATVGARPESTERSATPVATPREPVIAATPGRIVDPAGEAATPDPGTPTGRPAPVLGRQRPATSGDEPASTAEAEQSQSGTPASASGDGTTGASPSGPANPDVDDSGPETEPTTVTPTVDSCTPSEVPGFGDARDAFVVVENLYFRTGPGTDCDLIGDNVLEAGTALTVTSETVIREGQNTEWVRVDVDGQEGWVAAEFIEPQPE